MNLPQHLGGHANKTNLDTGAMEWIKKTFRPETFLDIGCGPGGMVELAELNGLDALGIDGDFTLQRYNPDRFLIHDFSVSSPELNKEFDVGWSCEFVEHVYEKFMPNYMEAFKKCKILIMTYAPPGFGGHHHVNEQPEEYWIAKLAESGFIYDAHLTTELRNRSTMNIRKSRKAFVKNRGLVFKRK